jgi:subtilisin family serine protease
MHWKACGSIFVILAAMTATAVAADRITLRVAPSSNIALMRAIAAGAEPKLVDLGPGDSIKAAIKRTCGHENAEYQRLFAEANADEADRIAGDQVVAAFTARLPACARWEHFEQGSGKASADDPGTVLSAEGDSIDAIAWHYIGFAGETTKKQIARLSHLPNPDTLPRGTLVRLPSRSERVELILKVSPEAFAESLFQAIGRPFPGYDQTCHAPRYAPGKATANDWSPIVSLCINRRAYPVNPAQVVTDCSTRYPEEMLPPLFKVREAVQTVRDSLKIDTGDPGTVLVADTGLLGYSTPENFDEFSAFAQGNFARISDADGKLHIGRTMAALDSPSLYALAPDPGFKGKQFWHGTHVLGIASGAALPSGDPGGLNPFLRLTVTNVLNPDYKPPELREEGIGKSFDHAFEISADVVNFSIQNPTAIYRFQNDSVDRRILVVAAAGNAPDGFGLDERTLLPGFQSFPAMYGGDIGDQKKSFITVAGHGPDGRLTTTTAVSQEYVDLAAPGFEVNSLINSFTGETGCVTGTSHAAPFVSLTAGLLYTLRGGDTFRDAWLVKQRILSSVDTDAALYGGHIFSRGRLNIIKAIRFDKDIIQFRDGKVAYVNIPKKPTDLCHGKKKYDPRYLRKIAPGYKTADGKVSHLVMYSRDRFLVEECEGKDFDVTFQEGEETRTVSSSAIRDIVFAGFPRKPW